MDDAKGTWLPALLAAVVVAIAAAYLGSSRTARASLGAHLQASADLVPPGTLATATIRTGQAGGTWTPYVPPGAHMGRHRMYNHPVSCSPQMTDVMRPGQYDWMFSPPSEGVF